MFAKMSNKDNGNGEQAPASKKKQGTIEKTYQKKTQLEHILLRPDTYIGSVEHSTEKMWIYDSEGKKMVQKEVTYVPGLYKIFDEILVNAADNKQRDKKMDCIKIEIDQEGNTISVWNNGQGIPVTIHKDEDMYVPTMIFGHLLTSSNYNDEEEKVTGGRNGYGAKLCNVFSTKFTVETASIEYKRHFKQTWGSNMTKASDSKVKDFFGTDFTKITFSPDLKKFKMDKLTDDIVGIMSRRAFDIAASTRGVKVYLNGKKLPVNSFKDYIDLYIKDKEDEMGRPLKIVYENVSDRWEVAITLSPDSEFQQMSFVNSIATTKGGKHVDYVADTIINQLLPQINKKNKSGMKLTKKQIRPHMWLFINCLIVNPTFDSQTKETMTLQAKSFGSKCEFSPKFISSTASSGIVESVLSWAHLKAEKQLDKHSGKKQARLKGISKLEEAHKAGQAQAMQCTMILTEGDSAKSLVMSALGVIGRDYYGVYPLRGKLLNVREATKKQISENNEIDHLVKILGLVFKKKYNTVEDMKTLRYGKVMIMTDQDQDGSHIKGLVINFIHTHWPELLRLNFLEEFITPIVKVTKRQEVISFYSLPEFEEWKSNTANHNTYSVKYYKGLGTSTAKEAKEYFSDMNRHRIRFRYQGQQDDDHILLAFSKKHIDHRKEWLTNFMVESKRRKEIGLSERYLYTKDTKFISYTDFVNLELVLFSNADNIRSIPSMVDGLKPGQRKVLFTCIKRNDKREVKVAQLSGSVAELSAYHHGEVSLSMTIVNLAQNFVGSNNINLLEPRGQFGTRYGGGKDSASPRYIFTKLSPITRMIFHPADDAVLKHEYDDNQRIEPVWYIPILPMVLVNGADGIGTGWMTKIPNYNPRQIIENLRKLLDGEEPDDMMPWYKNFKGTIQDGGDSRYVVSGEIAILGNDQLEITELPVGTWTQNYKENVLEPLRNGSDKVKPILVDYKEYNTDTTIRFVLKLKPGEMANLEKEGLHKVFKLQTLINTTSMCVFDDLGCLRRFDSVTDIIREYQVVRLKMYQKRKDFLEGQMEAEASKLSNQARFILEKCSGVVVVENKKRKTIVEELLKKGYDPDPVKAWKERIQLDEAQEGGEEDTQEEQEENTSTTQKKSTGESDQNLTDVKNFDYLLGMPMWMLTEERKNELLRQKGDKLTELETLKRKTIQALWREDMDRFMEKLDVIEEKERKDNEVGEVKEAVKKGGKKKLLHEVMPSPSARRIMPTVTEEIKKKIQNAVKSKENRAKRGVKKENIANEERDEFDLMVTNKKTLKDKIGTPEEAEKKAKGKKGKGDNMKQTKLTFEKKANGSPKGKSKKISYDMELTDDNDDSDIEFKDSASVVVPERTTSRRAAAARTIKYSLSDDEKSSEGEPELFDNSAINENNVVQHRIVSSDSEDDLPLPKHNETSDDLFDSLIGKKNDSVVEIRGSSPKPASKKAEATKRKRNDGPKKQTKKKNDFSSGDSSDDSIALVKKKPQQNKCSSDNDFEPPKRVARKPAQKFTFSDSDASNDSLALGKSKPETFADNSSDSAPIKKKAASEKKKFESSDDDDFIESESNDSDFEPPKKRGKSQK